MSTVTTPPVPRPANSTSQSEIFDSQVVYGDTVLDLSITQRSIERREKVGCAVGKRDVNDLCFNYRGTGMYFSFLELRSVTSR